MYNKQQIDADAEREALALDRQGKNNRPKRLRFETSSYNRQILDRLFIDDKYKYVR